MNGFGDEAVFLGGCPVIKPHDGIYVEGQRVIALAGVGVGDADFRLDRIAAGMLTGIIIGAGTGAYLYKRHRWAGGVAGSSVGAILGGGIGLLSK